MPHKLQLLLRPPLVIHLIRWRPIAQINPQQLKGLVHLQPVTAGGAAGRWRQHEPVGLRVDDGAVGGEGVDEEHVCVLFEDSGVGLEDGVELGLFLLGAGFRWVSLREEEREKYFCEELICHLERFGLHEVRPRSCTIKFFRSRI